MPEIINGGITTQRVPLEHGDTVVSSSQLLGETHRGVPLDSRQTERICIQNEVNSSVHVVGCTQVGNPFKISQVDPNEQVRGQLILVGVVGGARVLVSVVNNSVGVIEVGVVVELSTRPRASKTCKMTGKVLFGKQTATV